MQNFTFHNPTRIFFGRGEIARLNDVIPVDSRVLLTYGGGSIKRNGVYDQVRQALGPRQVSEFGGIEPNPTYETLMRAVAQAREAGEVFLLAVGGGSVLDGTKFIAAAVHFQGDPWDIVTERATITAALPLGTVLTLPATGSEANEYAVISRQETREKLSFGDPLLFPQFSILDPEATLSLPQRQIGNGVVDAFTHVCEQYLTYPAAAPLQDRMAEAVLRTLIEVGPATHAAPDDYDARATFMWCATLALNGLLGAGVPQDWATHAIGHELTALHGLDHGQTLAIVLPALLFNRRSSKRVKLLQYAERVWELRTGDEDTRIAGAIERTRAFFESLEVRTHLSAYGIAPDVATTVARRLASRGNTRLGERREIGPREVEEILLAAA